MPKNKRLVRLIVRVGYREPGRVIDKLVRDKAVQMRTQ